jgi:hypothetical protein
VRGHVDWQVVSGKDLGIAFSFDLAPRLKNKRKKEKNGQQDFYHNSDPLTTAQHLCH